MEQSEGTDHYEDDDFEGESVNESSEVSIADVDGSGDLEAKFTISNIKGQRLVKVNGEIGGNPFKLKNLTDCEVQILDYSLSVDIENVKNSYVFVGPCEDAALFKNCTNCVFVVVCRAFRAEDCDSCTFFVHTEGDPMIENCKDLLFAPFKISIAAYNDYPEHLKSAGYSAGSRNCWETVYDLSESSGKKWDILTTGTLYEGSGLSNFGKHKLRTIFRYFDSDMNGVLSPDEFKNFQETSGFFTEVNSPGISFDSFCELHENEGSRKLVEVLESLRIDKNEFDYFCHCGLDNVAFADADPKSDLHKMSVFDLSVHLLRNASSCGIDISIWFKNFDLNDNGKLPEEMFKNAFSGLLLGLCAAKPGEFNESVQELLSPDSINTLVDILKERVSPFELSYQTLITNALSDEIGTFTSHGQGDKLKESYSPAKKHKFFDASAAIAKQLTNFVQSDIKAIEILKSTINSWKWSVGGMSPVVRGDTFGPEGETISHRNLARALSVLGFSVSIRKVESFSKLIQSIETIDEKRARIRRNGVEKSQREVCVAALQRWLHSKKLECSDKSMSYLDWTKVKLREEALLDSCMRDKLKHALDNGGDSALQYLCNPDNRPLLEEMIQKVYKNGKEKFMPDDLLESEIQGEVDDYLESADGGFEIRRQAIRDSEGAITSMSLRQAKLKLKKAKYSKVNQRWRKEPSAKLELVLKFGSEKGRGDFQGSFLKWLEQRHSARESKRKKLKKWKLGKMNSLTLQKKKSDNLSVAKVSTVVEYIQGLVNKTYVQNTDEKSGIVTCRSSRYDGLDPEYYFAVVRKYENQGQLYISKRDFHDIFDNLLKVLSADPRTSKDASELLDPVYAAQQKLNMILSQDNKKAMKDVLTARQTVKNNKNNGSLDDETVHALALASVRDKYEQEIYTKIGFLEINDVSEKQNLVDTLKKEKVEQTKRNVKSWLKEKKKLEKVSKLQLEKNKLEQEEKDRQLKIKVKKNIRKWKKGLSKRQKENEKIEKRNQSKLASRPEWVGVGDDVILLSK